MPLPRVQLFEFNDAAWAPAILRSTLVESLSRAIRWGRLLDGVVEPLRRTLDQAGTHEILDLCAGAGGPAAALSEAMERRGVRAHFLMSDLYPSISEWEPLVRAHADRFAFVPQSVDATAIPSEVGEGRARVIINALHHFPPSLARDVLRGACEAAPAVFVAEALVRNPLSFAAMGAVGLAGLMSAPVVSRDHRMLRALLTWGSPIALGAAIWDGTVSSLRTYLPSELHDMVADLSGWQWTSGTFTHSAGLGTGHWFSGVRRS